MSAPESATSEMTVDLDFPIHCQAGETTKIEFMIPIDRSSSDFHLRFRNLPPLLILKEGKLPEYCNKEGEK